MNVCRVVHAAACAVAFALTVGVADAVTRVQPTAHRALQKDTAVVSLGDNFAQTFERKQDPDSAVTSPALLSVSSSSFWNHGSIFKLPPADTDAAALSKLHCYPDVYQLKDSSAVSYSEEESLFVYPFDAGTNYQQDGAVAHASHWEPESRGRSVVLQRRDATLYRKVADASSQTEWSSSPLDASDASCFNDDCGQYPSDDLLLAPISECDGGERGAADFSGVFESSSALSVGEINGVLSVLEEVASDVLPVSIISSSSSSSDTASLEENEHGAQNENPAVDMILSLEHVETPELFLAEVVDEVPGVFSSSLEENSADDTVTEPAFLVVPTEGSVAAVELLPALEESTSYGDDGAVAAGGNLTQPNWIDSLEMDNISSCLFPEMQQPKSATSLPQRDAVASPGTTGKIDSRVYVPKFSVRIEGRPPIAAVQPKPFVQSKDWSAPSTARSPQLPVDSQSFLVGPPPPVFAASSVLSRKARVERWKEKRRARSFIPRAPNPNLSESRKAAAAKRQRVGGRFIGCGGPTCAPFVAITALQS